LILTIWRYNITDVIQNSLVRVNTSDAVSDIVIETIVGNTLRTNQYAGGGTHLILLTILSTRKTSVI
jgi:hypothetical protein